MTSYNTGNPIGSKDPRDLYDNAENFDAAINDVENPSFEDRFGRQRTTLKGYDDKFQQFLLDSGYVNIGDYGPGLEITARNQIFWRDGELYRAGAALELPYTTTGDWGTEEGLFVAVGDQVLRQQLIDITDPNNNAGMIGFDGSMDYPEKSAGQALALVVRSSGTRRNLKYFGANRSGSGDASLALQNAIESGEPLLFEGGLYRIDSPIQPMVDVIDILSDGAEFFYPDNVNHISHLIDINLDGDLGLHPKITGALSIDGRSNCASGLRVYNRKSSYIDQITLSGVSVRNLRKHDTSVSSDGITVRGGFRYVLLDRPSVDNIAMAEGAGLLGTAGVNGILVHNDTTSGLYPIRTEVRSPYVNKIFSEDPEYTADQDGIKVFGFSDSPSSEDSSCLIAGGQFTNCWGRSIKLQVRSGTVNGTKFRRTEGFTRGYGNPEIDFQTGGGQVGNINCFYSGTGPENIVLFSNHSTRRGFPGLVRDCTVFSTGTTLGPLISNQTRNVFTGEFAVSGVQLQGSARAFFDLIASGASNANLSISDCYAHELTEALVLARSTGAGTCDVYARGNMNSGAAVPVVLTKIPGAATIAKVSDIGNIGFSKSPRVGQDANQSGITRVNLLTGQDLETGSMRFQSFMIANEGEVTFSPHGYYEGLYCTLITTNYSKNSHALVGVSSNSGCASLAAGSDMVVSTTQSPPSSGTFKVWSPDGTLKIRNDSGSTRLVTVMFFG